MKIRRVVSLTGLLSFLLMLLTSVILYIVPQGRIANWADWRLWNLSKEQWGGIHINVGILFLLCLLWHIYNNRRPIGLYLKTSKQKFQLFTKEFNLSLVIVIACAVGTYFDVPPFSTILGVSADIKESASKEYGEPPYGHAELSSLQTLAKRMDLDINDALKLLEAAGYYVDSKKQTINAVAKNNVVTPQQIYLVMNPNAANNSVVAGKLLSRCLPENPGCDGYRPRRRGRSNSVPCRE